MKTQQRIIPMINFHLTKFSVSIIKFHTNVNFTLNPKVSNFDPKALKIKKNNIIYITTALKITTLHSHLFTWMSILIHRDLVCF